MVDHLRSDWLRPTNQPKPKQTITRGQKYNSIRLYPSQFLFPGPQTFVAQAVSVVGSHQGINDFKGCGYESRHPGCIFLWKRF